MTLGSRTISGASRVQHVQRVQEADAGDCTGFTSYVTLAVPCPIYSAPLASFPTHPGLDYEAGRPCISYGGVGHDRPELQAEHRRVRTEPKGLGYQAVVIWHGRDLEERVTEYAGVFCSP